MDLPRVPRYSFCGICGNELEGLALVAWGRKSLFPCWPTLHYLFCYHIYRHGDTQKGHLGWCSSLYDSLFLLQPGLYSGMCTAHVRQMLPLIVLAWERFWETTLANQTKDLVVRNWKSIGMPSGLPLVHLHPALVIEHRWTSKTSALVRDRLGPTREGKLRWRVCLHTHPE